MHSEELVPGYVVDCRYVVEELLGRGSTGDVYVVSHVTTGTRLVARRLHADLLSDDELRERLTCEAECLTRLRHRHVVELLEIVRDGASLFLMMELLEGISFSVLLQDAELTVEDALVILLRAMEGVAAAHELGLVHGALEPDNIVVSVGASGFLDHPRVRGFRFGALEAARRTQILCSDTTLGAPYYMAPEQLAGARPLDPRVDVYAMGIILYELVMGTPPFTGDSMLELAARAQTQPVDLASSRPDLPPGLAAAIAKAMAPDRDHRFSTMRALIEAVRASIPSSAWLLVPDGRGRAGRGEPEHDIRAHSGAPVLVPQSLGSPSYARLSVGVILVLALGVLALWARHEPVAAANGAMGATGLPLVIGPDAEHAASAAGGADEPDAAVEAEKEQL